jgi:hypothetical protein
VQAATPGKTVPPGDQFLQDLPEPDVVHIAHDAVLVPDNVDVHRIFIYMDISIKSTAITGPAGSPLHPSEAASPLPIFTP